MNRLFIVKFFSDLVRRISLVFWLCQALETLTSASAASLAASKDTRSSEAILSHATSPSIKSQFQLKRIKNAWSW